MSREEILKEFNLKECSGEEIKPGDFYIAERNSGPKLLEARKIVSRPYGFIIPNCGSYPYDIDECIKVIEDETAKLS